LHDEPIAGATLTLRAVGGQPAETYTTRTGADGCFSIDGMPPGLYDALPSKIGYGRSPHKSAAEAVDPRAVYVEAGKAAPPLRLRLIPDGVITGTVTDDSGDPVRRVVIEVQQYGYVNGKRQLRTVSSAGADDRGRYRLFYVPPGKYRLRASPSNATRPMRFGPIAAPAQTGSGLAAAYYPGSPDAAHASEIELAPGAELDGIDFHLSEQRLYSIRGRLLNLEDGHGISVTAQGIGERSISPVATRFESKQYQILGLAPGKYVVVGQEIPIGGPQARKFARESVEIINRDVDGVDLSLTPAAILKGVVKAEGDVALRNVAVNLVPLDRPDGFFEASAHVATDGALTIDAPPGLYRIEAFGPSLYLKSVIGKDNVPDLKIDAARASGDLTLIVADDFGKVEGTVTDEDGKPVADADVTLLPAHPRDEWDNRYFHVSTKTDGGFAFSSVIPGDYRAFAWLGAEPGAAQDPDFRKPYEDRAVTVTAAPNGQETLKLKAIRAGS
jgi:protocatechuate 3,4-dioxygenase beta subunit